MATNTAEAVTPGADWCAPGVTPDHSAGLLRAMLMMRAVEARAMNLYR
jgi:hypothetical protein